MLVLKSDGVTELMQRHRLPIARPLLIKSFQVERFLSGPGDRAVDAVVANERIVTGLIEAYADVSHEIRVGSAPASVVPRGPIDAEIKLQIGVLGPFRDGSCDVLMKTLIPSPKCNLHRLPWIPPLCQADNETRGEATTRWWSDRAQRALAKLNASLESIRIAFHDETRGPAAGSAGLSWAKAAASVMEAKPSPMEHKRALDPKRSMKHLLKEHYKKIIRQVARLSTCTQLMSILEAGPSTSVLRSRPICRSSPRIRFRLIQPAPAGAAAVRQC